MKQIHADDHFKIHPNAVYTFIDHEAIMISGVDDCLFGLNETATELLKQLEYSPSSLKSLCDYLLAHYEVDEKQCMIDINHFIESLLEQELIIRLII